MSRKIKRGYKILIGIVIILIVFRLFLPYIVLHYANNKLGKMDGYYGHVDDIDIALYRGAYKINDIDVPEAIFELLRNAFIQALMPSIDNEINLKSVEEDKPEEKKNFLQRLFGSGKKDKEQDKDKDKKKDKK